jgi:serine/threonine-protein kinase RsbW
LAWQSRGSGGRHYALVGASAVGVVRRSVGADLAVAGADEQARFDCLVALTEACTNALVHGHGEATPRVSWRIDGATARFCIEDYSEHRWAKPTGGNRDPSGARIGGFGLQLMRRLMDRVDISIEEHGTTVELAKRIR